jgi:prepilin-type N-terminal cleavage/methylation domain-containing protein
MRTPHRTLTSPRRGFTLVEMLVVVGVIAGLAALTVLLFPRLQDSQRSTKAADLVQQQLFVAKQMALRDQQPRGVRFVSSVGSQAGPFDQLQLIEQPAAYSTGVVPTNQIITNPTSTWPLDPNGTGWYVVPFGADPVSGAVPDFSNNTVQAGDLLDLSAANDQYTIPGQPGQPGALHLIMKVQVLPPQVFVLTQPQISYTGSPFPSYYRILRSPRPLTGEAVVNLPRTAANNIGMAVDSPSTAYPNAKPTQGSLIPQDTDGNYQVMFDPSGKVLRASGTQGKVVLWVKNFDPDNKWVADEILIAVYTRNGLITSQPVNLNANLGTPNFYPYFFVTDGATSGM